MLRIAIYSLLLANILLIAMRMLQPDAESTNEPARIQYPAEKLPTIELARNLPDIPVTTPASASQPVGGDGETGRESDSPSVDTTTAPAGAEEESMACIQVGPFETQDSMADLRAELDELFDRVQYRESRSIVDNGYWVYLPKYATRAEAQQVIKNMTTAGARDFYIVPDGPMANAISLGVYERRERAEDRRQSLNNLGLAHDFMIEPQTKIETQYWLEAGPVNALNPTLIELSYNNPETQQIQVECTSGNAGTRPGMTLDELATDSNPVQQATEQN